MNQSSLSSQLKRWFVILIQYLILAQLIDQVRSLVFDIQILSRKLLGFRKGRILQNLSQRKLKYSSGRLAEQERVFLLQPGDGLMTWIIGSFLLQIAILLHQGFLAPLIFPPFVLASRLLAKQLFYRKSAALLLQPVTFIPIFFPKFHLIILQIHKDPTLHGMLNYFSKHFIVFNHQVSNLGVQGILGVRIGQNINQPAYYACQGDSWGKVLSDKGQTYIPLVTDVWVVNFVQARQFWWVHWVCVRELQPELDSTG